MTSPLFMPRCVFPANAGPIWPCAQSFGSHPINAALSLTDACLQAPTVASSFQTFGDTTQNDAPLPDDPWFTAAVIGRSFSLYVGHGDSPSSKAFFLMRKSTACSM